MVRQAAEPAAILRRDAFGPKSAVEGFFAKQDEDPFMFPGMDAALFTEGMAPGAYNAQRIRNGQDPLWDQEMIDGFRKAD